MAGLKMLIGRLWVGPIIYRGWVGEMGNAARELWGRGRCCDIVRAG